jgi:hypothetical protein
VGENEKSRWVRWSHTVSSDCTLATAFGYELTVRSWNSLLTLANLARSLTANSGRIYSNITSVGTFNRLVGAVSSDPDDIA